MKQKKDNLRRYRETKLDVQTYIDRLRYAVADKDTVITFQEYRASDNERPDEYTNWYTFDVLFGDEKISSTEILRRELAKLEYTDYQITVEDRDFPNNSNLRVFGKEYGGSDVYIKLRVELVSPKGREALVLSFHFAERRFAQGDFPFKV